MVGGTTVIQKEIIARSLGASGPRGESGGTGASGLAPGVGFSIASEVAAQGRCSGKGERGVHLGGAMFSGSGYVVLRPLRSSSARR